MNKPQIKIHFGIQFDLEQPFQMISEKCDRLKKSEIVKQIFVHQIPKDNTLEEYYQISITFKEKWISSFDLEEVLDILLNEIDNDELIDVSKRFNGNTVLYIATSPNSGAYPSLSISSSQMKQLSKFNDFSLDIEVYHK